MQFEELLDTVPLKRFLPLFLEAGFDDMEFILAMDKDEWESMLDAVDKIATAKGAAMRPGERARVLFRLKREKIRKESEVKADPSGSGDVVVVRTTTEQAAAEAPRVLKDMDLSGIPDESGVTKRAVLWEGCTCFQQHWMFCFGLCVLSLIVSLFLLLLLSQLNTLDNNTSDASNGGWAFVYIAMIFGFSLTGVTLLLCMVAFYRGDGPSPWEDCHPDTWCDGVCAGVFAALAACCAALHKTFCSFTCDCCDDVQVGARMGAMWSSITNSAADSMDCCSCTCPECSCGQCELPSCSCAHFFPSCPELECPTCADVSCPAVTCDCCPSCGDVRDCCGNCWRILCCRCQITISR